MARPEIGLLLDLQKLDLEMARLRAEREALTRALAARAPAPAEVAYAKVRALLATCQREQRAAEATLDDLRVRHAAQQQKLYSGAVPAKDLAALEREVAHLRAMEEDANERVFTCMVATEDAEQRLAQAEQAVRAVRAERTAHQREQRERLDALEGALADLDGRRATAASALEPSLLSRYEALRASHAGRALAEVAGGVCQACRMEVSRAVMARASTGSVDAICDNCGRIVYLAGEARGPR